jgi:hypothetical protein
MWVHLNGLRILSALRRNVREGKTRALIMGHMIQKTLGNGGASAMIRLLPYMNYQTWKNEDVFGDTHWHYRVSSQNELKRVREGPVPPARNVKRLMAPVKN